MVSVYQIYTYTYIIRPRNFAESIIIVTASFTPNISDSIINSFWHYFFFQKHNSFFSIPGGNGMTQEDL